ncbi:MAG: acetate--CoA ligase family protein [Roseobacter sp.]
MRDLNRLLRPGSIAVVGGGAWCRQIIHQTLAMGFAGEIYRVHPKPNAVEGIPAVQRIADLPSAPDAVFLGINRHATLDAIAELSAMGAGGAVCFASGFSEAMAEDASGVALQKKLIAAAGQMPVLGPNCYGFVNAVDGALLWPDQHGCRLVERGAAVITQSSNIAINLSMQQRGLPISYVVTCGNMAQTSQAEIALALLEDPRVTAIGLHVEGFGDTTEWHQLACKAQQKNIPLIVLKVGASEQAQRATISHTASLAGSDVGADALLQHLALPRVYDLPTFLETLMLLHCNGRLSSPQLSSISCSGGEASLVADMAKSFAVDFPALTQCQRAQASVALGDMVALSNPLDYHTYVWGDVEKMTAAWLPMAAEHIGLVLIVIDYPHTDAAAWECATQAAISVHQASRRPIAVVSSLPELLPEGISKRLIDAGVTPLHGVREALGAAEAAAHQDRFNEAVPLGVAADGIPEMLLESEAKACLSRYGVIVPKNVTGLVEQLAVNAAGLQAPLALKALGLAHKSEAGALRLHLTHDALQNEASAMRGETFLVEEMVQNAVAELLVGVTRDAAHGYVLTLAAGGVLTELWQDRVSLLVPATQEQVTEQLQKLRIYPLLRGYRNAPKADMNAIVRAIMSVQDFVVAEAASLYEIEINPLICTGQSAVAADALIARLPDANDAGDTDGSD